MPTEPIKLNLGQAKIMESNMIKSSEFKFNEQLVKEHFSKIEKLINEYQGKKGYNPFLWLHENVNSLADRFRGWTELIKTSKIVNGQEVIDRKEIKHPPERTKELQDAILAIPLEIPKLEMSVDSNPTEYNIHQQRPLGLNLPQKSII